MAASLTTPKYTLEQMRILTGVTRETAARTALVNESTLDEWEQARTTPSLVALERLLTLYGYRFDQLETSPYQQPPDTPKYTLQEMRLASNVPASDAARTVGVSYRSLRNWETAVNIPSIVHTNALLQLYGYTLDQLELAPFDLVAQEREDRVASAKRNRPTRIAPV